MKKFYCRFFCLALIVISGAFTCVATPSGGSGNNLIENGSFEEEGKDGLPRGWQIVPHHIGRGEVKLDKKSVHSGKYSLRISPSKKNTSEGFGVFMMLNAGAVSGKNITISSFVRVEGFGSNAVGIVFKTNRTDWLILPNDTGKQFAPFSKTFSVDAAIPEAAILILVNGTKGTVWLDDLSLAVAQITPPASGGKSEVVPETKYDEYSSRINSLGWQDSAFISPDGNELYFAYVPYGQKDFTDIFLGKIAEKDVKIKGPVRPGSHGTMNFETYKSVRKKDGTWDKPVNLNINSTDSLYAAKLSFDGSELYYVMRDVPGGYGAGDIYVSTRLPDGNWSKPENLGPNINTQFIEDTPCLGPDGKTLYFAGNRFGEGLGFEIMVSKKINGQWTMAEKLGPPINEPNPTTSANHQPFLTADGKTLYFSRIQHLYKSEKTRDGSWGKPVKVFDRMAGHASVTADGRYLYFITYKDKESLRRHQWTVWYSEKQRDGEWGEPKPVD